MSRDRADASWESFAAREPYFAVLTADRFRRQHLNDENLAAFFATGEDVVSWALETIDASILPQFAPMSILEYGCGVGRLAIPLAARFGSVVAVDYSEAMLQEAQRAAQAAGQTHITFQTAASFRQTKQLFDCVLCYRVIQRMARGEGLQLVRDLIGRLAPNGVAILQFPFRTRVGRATAAARWGRQRSTLINTAANAMLGKDTAEPFVPTTAYAIDEIEALCAPALFHRTLIEFEHGEDTDSAVLFARKRELRSDSGRGRPSAVVAPASGLDAPSASAHAPRGTAPAVADRDTIAAANLSAELYFSSLKDWDYHLGKPFSAVAEVPSILNSLSVTLNALQLSPGLTVLEFGAGSGWLSRFLAQMGCRVIVMDVSATALDIARELFRRQPPVGDVPSPTFLPFDGHRIECDTASIDRVVCFDAFHHALNPDAMIREFARVLTPRGIAAFAEPGQRHSEAPKSKFEVDTYGVVELDIDVHALWRTAQAAGFSDIKLSVFNGPNYQVSLDEYTELVTGGAAEERWLASTRQFLRQVRNFSLSKGAALVDSTRPDGLRCEIQTTQRTTVVLPGESAVVDVTVRNTGAALWRASDGQLGAVWLGAHLYSAKGELLNFEYLRQALTTPPVDVGPGGHAQCRCVLPALATGDYLVEFDCVADGVLWFAQAGSHPVRLRLQVR